MRKCHLSFVEANLFRSEINQINIYVTKWRMLQRNVKQVLITQTLWVLNNQLKPKKNNKDKIRSYCFNYSVTSFIVILIIPSCAAIGCVNRSGKNPSLSFHQSPSNKQKENRQQWLCRTKLGQNEENLPINSTLYICSEHFEKYFF